MYFWHLGGHDSEGFKIDSRLSKQHCILGIMRFVMLAVCDFSMAADSFSKNNYIFRFDYIDNHFNTFQIGERNNMCT